VIGESFLGPCLHLRSLEIIENDVFECVRVDLNKRLSVIERQTS